MKILYFVMLVSLMIANAMELELVKKPGAIDFIIHSREGQFKYQHHGIKAKADMGVFPVRQGNMYAYSQNNNLVVLDVLEKRIVLREVLPGHIVRIQWIDQSILDIEIAIFFRNKNNKQQTIFHNYQVHLKQYNDFPGGQVLDTLWNIWMLRNL